jgi:hypothetical protein
MSAHSRSPRSRPNSVPTYYLARPASWWITALHRQPPAGRPAGNRTAFQPERNTR